MEADGDKAGKLQQSMLVTGTDTSGARAVLQGSGWNVDAAVDFFFATGCCMSLSLCVILLCLTICSPASLFPA